MKVKRIINYTASVKAAKDIIRQLSNPNTLLNSFPAKIKGTSEEKKVYDKKKTTTLQKQYPIIEIEPFRKCIYILNRTQ